MDEQFRLSFLDVWNHSFESIILFNEQGTILSLNRPAARLFSESPSTLNGASIYELIPSEDFKKCLQKKGKTGVSILLGTKQLVANISFFENNELYLLFLKDISQVQLLQHQIQELKKTKQLFNLILDQLEEGISVIDEQGRLLFYNLKAGEMDTLEPEAVRNKRVQDVWNVDENTSTLLTSLRTRRTLHHRETKFSSHGKAITTLARTVPLVLNENVSGAIEILKDITEQKHLSDTILQLQKQGKGDLESSNSFSSQKNNTRFQFEDIIFSSREMAQSVEQARRSARSKSNILIVGETGTGKELFAQSIHNESPRKDKPFIAQNCAALPESLLESLLFGTTAGSFTGAVNRPGLFEQAQGGSLMLDEINSMSINLQAKLLRVIQERKVQRLGSTKVIDIDVRIVATMNEEPLEAIANQRLREDLYYRLGVVNLVIPPLRNRKEDLRVLIDHFITKHADLLDVQVDGVDQDVFHYFMNFGWPGNVRQLEHVIEGCLNLVYDERTIGFNHLPPIFKNKIQQAESTLSHEPLSSFSGSLPEQIERLERVMIEQAMNHAQGNITKAAEQLGISRQNLNYKLKKFQIFF
ncbi:PAS domain S-box protein [Bacillus salipaludis]|uniref:PAS domain S-box protein n=1 Tax=Bacillus salipaludis TaxID=2547811 RepID=A0A4R5VIW8_9BACI|nr:sigma 54-interacting transcriptional regulator [Bacillus salipaludis]MDQ6600557.1 sigma 54-interacting transcriptional regulator [Bacillus salipaludis]TDK55961.1 PAS domain S-box protein [Bacillus salipaludis]